MSFSTKANLTTLFGLRGKPYASMNTPDIIGSQLGWNITQFEERFGNYYALLKNRLKWSDADILGRTYFTAAYNEFHLLSYMKGINPIPLRRSSAVIPEGKWFYNSELRSGVAEQSGYAPQKYYGDGGTELVELRTNWKSHFGYYQTGTYVGLHAWNYPGEGGYVSITQTTASFVQPAAGANVTVAVSDTSGLTASEWIEINGAGKYYVVSVNSPTSVTLRNEANNTGLYNYNKYFDPGVGNQPCKAPGVTITSGKWVCITAPAALSFGGGWEWCHGFRVTDLCMTGTKGSGFNNASERSTGVVMWWPGENSGVFNCLLTEYNDFGFLVSGAPAPFRSRDNSMFWNGVARVGIRGCARADIEIGDSGDYNPYGIYMFRGGETLQSPNGQPYWPCFQDMNPGGYITWTAPKTESFACRSGYNSYATCTPDIAGKGQMLARLTGRFRVNLVGGTSHVHLGRVDTAFRIVDDFYENGGAIPLSNSAVTVTGHAPVSFAHWFHIVHQNVKYVCRENDDDQHSDSVRWAANENGGIPYNPYTGVNLVSQQALYKGLQPFKNNNNPGVWNHNAAPNWGYNTVTGANY